MKILLLHQYFLEKDSGGGSRFNQMVQQWSEQGGHTVTVISGMIHYQTGLKDEKYKGKYTYKEKLSDRVEVIRSHVSSSYNSSFLGRLRAYFSFVFSSLYAGLFRSKKKYDIILATSPPLFIGISAYLLSRFKGIPLVFEVRDLWPESAIDSGVLHNKMLIKLAYRFERFMYKSSKRVIVLTPAFKKKLIEVKKVIPEKVSYIPKCSRFYNF